MNELLPIIRRKRRPLLPVELPAVVQIPVVDLGELAAPEPVKVTVANAKTEPEEVADATQPDI